MTDKNGEAVVRGLDDSYTYNFKEIKAPEGYSVNTTDSVATWGKIRQQKIVLVQLL
ncbi:prealbumin-like fold domain-containing protein [Blautia sp. LMAG:89]|uniref:prealbumin-like fold domain-containing protein n=1 Tax=Blautia sp. LMAG:89 TaxID=1969173 RepID=UPI00257A9A96|nr:prealbumin-like fold domain-containing protein [Blautia sp. LMAG:89]